MPLQLCADGCTGQAVARGLCINCYKRHRRAGTLAEHAKMRSLWMPSAPANPVPRVHGSPVLPARIWAKLRVTDSGCWEWTGKRINGYGQVFAGGTMVYVHRLAYTVFVGEIPDNHDLDHYLWPDGDCIGPPCALHTRPTTRRENTLRSAGFTSWNLAKEHCPAGHPYSGANLYLNKKGYRDCRTCRRARKRRS